MSHIHVDDSWSGRVRDAARHGVVVYVMRSLSLLDFLCLDFLVKRFGLPVLRFVNYLGIFGPSQAGKSFLVGAMLSHELGNLTVLDIDGLAVDPTNGIRTS